MWFRDLNPCNKILNHSSKRKEYIILIKYDPKEKLFLVQNFVPKGINYGTKCPASWKKKHVHPNKKIKYHITINYWNYNKRQNRKLTNILHPDDKLSFQRHKKKDVQKKGAHVKAFFIKFTFKPINYNFNLIRIKKWQIISRVVCTGWEFGNLNLFFFCW